MHLQGSEEFRRVALATDLFLREAGKQFLLLADFGLLLELPNSSNVFPLEICQAVREKLLKFASWASDNIKYLYGQSCYRERETLRLVLQFDQDKNLYDQSGPYFPGLK